MENENTLPSNGDCNKLLPYLPPHGTFSPKEIKLNGVVLFSRDEVGKIIMHLVAMGFAEIRYDLQAYGLINHSQLTKEGRQLKERGSIENYHLHYASEESSKTRQKIRDAYLFWIVLFGAFGTCVSAAFDGAQLLDFYDHHYANYLKMCYVVTGLLSGITLSVIIWMLKKVVGKRK